MIAPFLRDNRFHSSALRSKGAIFFDGKQKSETFLARQDPHYFATVVFRLGWHPLKDS
jgi:hypothetical protein